MCMQFDYTAVMVLSMPQYCRDKAACRLQSKYAVISGFITWLRMEKGIILAQWAARRSR